MKSIKECCSVSAKCGPGENGMLCGKRLRCHSVDEFEDGVEAGTWKVKCHRRGSGDACAIAEHVSCSGNETPLIFSQYEVVRTILSKLSLQDLRSAAQVCSSWNSIAKIILQSRTKVEWFLGLPYPSLEEVLKTNLYCDPKLCIVFLTRMKSKLSQCVYNHVGPECVTLRVQGSGIVGTEAGAFRINEIEGGISRLGISAVLMPKIPGVVYRTFELPFSKLKQINNKVDLTPKELCQLTSIDPKDEVKCLLLFCGSCSEKMKRLVLSIQNRQMQRLVVGGAVCSVQREKIFGVALSGPNVVAASMLLPSSVTSKSMAEKYFEKFQKDTKNIEAKQTVCLMFACVGRGKMMYGEPNVESLLFRKYFPHTPLVGFFGFGEIGCDSIPDMLEDRSNLSDASDDNFDVYLHEFSSVFVYLGFS